MILLFVVDAAFKLNAIKRVDPAKFNLFIIPSVTMEVVLIDSFVGAWENMISLLYVYIQQTGKYRTADISL